MKVLNSCLQRELKHEMKEYTVDKKIANLICDMGFIMSENPKESGRSKFHRLIKQTDKHMIVVTYKIRRRLIDVPKSRYDKTD